MLITNFNNFILESLILESRMVYSKRFSDILYQIKSNKIAKQILQLVNVEAEFAQNYIDISKNKDEVSFITNRKADQLIGAGPIKYKIVDERRYLNRGERIFSALGYKRPDHLEPLNLGTIGTIKAEVKSSESSNVYVLFQSDSGTEIVMNKSAVQPYNPAYDLVWTSNRNPIKVGRFVRSILNTAKIEFTDSDIEKFVNAYKSVFDILDNAFSKFDVVQGKDIAYWYNSDNYGNLTSTLGNSCMASVDPDFFDIYCESENCSLVILYDDRGEIIDGRYKSKKIKGRALLWQTIEGDIFLDRIYTNKDSDVDLFIKYAHSREWWTKVYNGTSTSFNVSNGTINKRAEYTVKVKSGNYSKYPYVDSLSYLNTTSALLSNKASKIRADAMLSETGGGYDEINSDEY